MLFYNCGFFSAIYEWGEVKIVEQIISFIMSVEAGIIAYYICKWLDGHF